MQKQIAYKYCRHKWLQIQSILSTNKTNKKFDKLFSIENQINSILIEKSFELLTNYVLNQKFWDNLRKL